ncbi:DNA primase [gamma proteobacterium HdN1]|nr:DNA primase [gamma proteobacterium HdN1]
MAGRIPDQFIDDLLSRVDLVALIDRHLPLKRSGRNFTRCCPFHQEKTPSFSVSPEKQFYYCFGCGASGNAVSFLMDYSHLSFVEAIESLAKSIGAEVPRDEQQHPKGPDLRPLYQILEQARAFFSAQLKKSRERERALGYLRKRQLDAEIIERFQLGYAPPGWDNLISALGTSSQAKALLLQTGMVVQSQQEHTPSQQARSYDRFRDRIMFPIRDASGRTIAFGGRVLGDEKPKYLNSPETPVFHKGKTLYGFYEARQARGKLERFIVVEGYMDVIALAQSGITCAVATLGTACTREHVETLFRIVDEVVFCFDGDRAGRAAAWRALENTLPAMREGRTARFHFLPDGEDPDTQVRKDGPELFLAQLQKALPLPEYLFDHLMGELNIQTLDGRAKLAHLALPLIEQLPKGVLQELMIDRLAELVRMSRSSLESMVKRAAPEPPSTSGHSQVRAPQKEPANDRANVHHKPTPSTSAPSTSLSSDPSLQSSHEYDADLQGYADMQGYADLQNYADRPNYDLETGGYGPNVQSHPSDVRGTLPEAYPYERERDSAPAPRRHSKQNRFEDRRGERQGKYDRRWPDKATAPAGAPVVSLVDATIRSLLQRPNQAAELVVPSEIHELSQPHVGLLLQLLEYLAEYPQASIANLLGRWHATDDGAHLAALAAHEFIHAGEPLQNELGDALQKLHLMQVEQELDALINANIPDTKRLRELLHLKQQLSTFKH